MNQLKKQWHRILSLLVVATIILSGVPVTAVSAAETATAGVTSADATSADNTAIGLSGEIEPDNGDDEQEPDPVDEGDGSVATSGVTVNNDGESCTCTAFQSDPDCPVCKDDAAQCFFYYCVCEALCGEDNINHDCPICRDDYTKCVQAVEVPELAATAVVGGVLTINVTSTGTLKSKIDADIGSGTNTDVTTLKLTGGSGFYVHTLDTDGGSPSSFAGFLDTQFPNLITIDLSEYMGTFQGGSTEGHTFRKATKITTVKLKSGASLGRYMFYGCTALTTVGDTTGLVDLSGCTSFDTNVLAYCAAITTVKLPADVAIGNHMFLSCSNLTTVYTGEKTDNLINLSQYTPTSFGLSAFHSCTSITTVKLPANAAISNHMFYGCTNLKTVGDTTGVIDMSDCTSFGTYTFNGCTSITTVKLPTSLSAIKDLMFFGCTGLKAIAMPTTKPTFGTTPFTDVPALLLLVNGGSAQKYSDITGLPDGSAFPNIAGTTTLNTGDTLTLTVMPDASTASAVTYQWKKDGVDIGGATSRTYSKTGVGVADSGNYTCAVSLAGTTYTTDATAVTVDIPKVYVKSDGNDTTGNGTSVSPYATIAKAYNEVPSGGEILVMDTITVNPIINLTGTKTVTLKSASGTQTIKRGATGQLITVNTGVTLILENITIDGDKSGSFANGGGSLVTVEYGGTLTMNNGAVLQNNTRTSGNGGGVFINGGAFNMNDGEISGNSASDILTYGGGVLINNGNFTMNGGKISNNTTGANGVGGVYVFTGTFTVGGNAKIENNTANGNPANVSLANNQYITLGTPAAGMEIYVTKLLTLNDGVFVNSGATADHVQYFKPDDTAKKVELEGNTLKLVTAATPITTAAISGITAPVVAAAPNTTASGTGNFSIGAVTWTPTVTGGKFRGGTQYTATVTLTANSGYTFTGGLTTATINGNAATVSDNTGGTATLAYTFAATAAATVTGVSINAQPTKLSYSSGESLALAGLVATLTYNDGTTGNVAFADFGTNGLTASPANGTALNMSHNGTTVTVTHTATGNTAQTNTLTVSKATPSGTWPTGLTATYGQALSEISLASYTTLGTVTGTFSWTTSTDKVGNVGTPSHSMTFTPSDGTNYNTATNSVSITVNKKDLTITDATHTRAYDGTTDATGVSAWTFNGYASGDSAGDVTASSYTAAYTSANAGTATINVTAMTLGGTKGGNYSVTLPANGIAVTGGGITKKDISINTVAALTKTYDVGATATAGAVTFTGTVDTLTAGTDYTVTAVFTGGNYNAGGSKPYTYTVTMGSTTAANNYNLTGGNTKTGSDGTINKAPTGLSATTPSAITILSTDTTSRTFDLDSIVLNKSDCGTRSYALNGGLGGTVAVLNGSSVSLGGTNDATLTYQGAGQTSGSATQSITITTANYENITVTITFTATDKNDVSNSPLFVFTDGSATYDGSPKAHATATYNGSGANITYSYSGTGGTSYGPTATAPTNAGSYTVTAKYEDAANIGTKTVNFTVNPRNISNAVIAAIGNQTYTGSAITPTPSVSDSGAAITTNDYTVSYSGNTNVGTATVTLTGQNNYTGTKTATFNIVAIPLTSAAITVTAPAKGGTPNLTANGTGNFGIGAVSWNPGDSVFKGGTAYTATVTLTADSGYTFIGLTTATINGNSATVSNNTGSAVTLSYNFPATAAKTVSGISIKTPPNLVYVAGDKLNLTTLIVKVDYDDTTTEDIAHNKTGLTYEIDGTAVTSGTTVLTNSAHDGKNITITYGGKTTDTSALTVYLPISAQIAVTDITAASAKITYSATTDSRNSITSKLQIRSGSAWSDVAGTSSPQSVSGLAPDTTYEYRVWAKDNTTNKEYTKPVTFKTSAAAPAGITVDGDIIDTSSPAAIWVTLEHGNTVISSAQATAKGGVANTFIFSFSNVPNGIFNLVVDNGSWKVTQAVTVVNGAVTNPVGGITIDMSTGRTQSIVDIVTNDTPPAAVNGLPDLFSDSTIYTTADAAIVTGGGTVEIKLAVEKKDNPADASLITDKALGQSIGMYVDLSVIKSQLDGSGALLGETTLTDLNGNHITITFELPDDLKGKNNLTIYRVHNGSAEALTSTPNAAGETAVISGDIVTLTVCKFSTYAIAYMPTNPNPPSPTPSGGDSSSGGGSGGGTGSSVVSTYWIEVAEAKAMAKTAKQKELDYVRSRRIGITGIRKNSLLALAKDGLRYQHDTVVGNAVQVRVYVGDPSKATKDILVSGYVKGDTVDKTKSRFEKWFTNKFAVVSLEQQGDFGMTVQIAAKVDLSGMDTNNLYFYGYDRKTNKYNRINTEYRIDTNGYLHFATGLAGDIIVSNGPLTKKTEAQIAAGGNKYNYLAAQSIHEITNNTGGDSIPDISEPPMQKTPQNSNTGGDSLSYMDTADVPLKLEKVDNQSGGGALLIDLDAPLVRDVPTSTQKDGKPSALIIGGIAAVILLAAMMLWAAIPRKNDTLVSDADNREKQ